MSSDVKCRGMRHARNPAMTIANPRAPSDATSRRPRVSNARKFARRRTRCAVMAGSRATTGRCRNAAINTPVRRRILRCGQKPRARLRQPSNVAANAGSARRKRAMNGTTAATGGIPQCVAIASTTVADATRSVANGFHGCA